MKRGPKQARRGTRKLILRNFQSPGDIVMLTAAVRDLHLSYPGRFVTDVRTSCPALWENNPYLTRLEERAKGVEVIECGYPLIQQSNQGPFHFIHGFTQNLGEQLQLNIRPSLFQGDIHLSAAEKGWVSQVEEITGRGTPFWIIVAGGKRDFTAKWWATERYQQVVDYFRGWILFVQVGEAGHYHPALSGVLDLRGRTDIRQFVRLMHHAQGVLCPVTFAMHLAAAVEVKDVRGSKFKVPSSTEARARRTLHLEPGTWNRSPANRPCVVVAGGREPSQWEAYPHHQYIHTIGALPCCAHGGCWKSRAMPLGDGDAKDQPPHLCTEVVGNLPRCLHAITADEVIRRIELYFQGGMLDYLTPQEWASVAPCLVPSAQHIRANRVRSPGGAWGGRPARW